MLFVCQMRRQLVLAILLSLSAVAQRRGEFESRAATILENDRIELTTLNRGGAFVSLLLKDDTSKTNPMWNPIALARMTGVPPRFGDSIGHFVCVDGFGPTSQEERDAGLEGHGEAHRQPWQQISAGRIGNSQKIKWRATLPLVLELFTREVEIVDGEQVVYVDSELESLLSFDRPINWAEHATIGYPFLSPGKTVVDASVGRCQTRPHDGKPPHRLDGGKEFTYPNPPLLAGGVADIRSVPSKPNSMDHTGCVFDTTRRLGFVTAIDLERKLMLGYVLRREEFPWLQEWMNYPSNLALSRGLEFGTQPFDVSRRQTVETGSSLFGLPAFRWLPAKSKITTRFLMFYTRVPDGFTKVDDVRLENGALTIEDKRSGKSVRLAASRGL